MRVVGAMVTRAGANGAQAARVARGGGGEQHEPAHAQIALTRADASTTALVTPGKRVGVKLADAYIT